MVRIIWTEQATQDLENIAAFIALDSVRFAKITVRNIRELLYKSCRIIYHLSNNNLVHILQFIIAQNNLIRENSKGLQLLRIKKAGLLSEAGFFNIKRYRF